MVVFFVGVVAGRVVAADDRPAGVFGGVGAGGVEEVAVEKEGGAGLHFAVDQFQAFHGFVDAFGVCAGLLTKAAVVDASQVVGAFKDLEAAVGLDGAGVGAGVRGAGSAITRFDAVVFDVSRCSRTERMIARNSAASGESVCRF